MYRFLIFIIFFFKLTVIHSQETHVIAPEDLVVFFSTDSNLTDVTVDLSGNFKVTPTVKNWLEQGKQTINVCILHGNGNYVGITKDDWIKIINYQISKIYKSLQSDNSPEIYWIRGDCGSLNYEGNLLTIDSYNTYGADILIFQSSEIDNMQFNYPFNNVYVIKESDVYGSLDEINTQINSEMKQIAIIEERYRELALNKDQSHIGSINLKYPNQNQNINLCTLILNGYSAIPIIVYPTFDLNNTYTSGLMNASKENLKNIDKFNPYSAGFNDLEEFFELWQLNNQNCDTFVSYPSDLIRFVDAASKINKDFFYEFNQLIEIKKLNAHWAKLYGYQSWDDWKFADQINGDIEIISKLKQYNITNFNEYISINDQMIFEGYFPEAKDGFLYGHIEILEYLDDLNVANSKGTTAIVIKKQRIENERIAKELEEQKRIEEEKIAEQKRIEEEKIAEQERKERLAELAKERQMKIDSGNGDFVFYGDNEKCTENDNKICVDREQFLQICKKVEGYYNPRNGTIFALLGFTDSVIKGLNKNMGKNAFSEAETYVSKGGNCIFSFRASGTYEGSYYDRKYYCRVEKIKGDEGWFGTSDYNWHSCQYN